MVPKGRLFIIGGKEDKNGTSPEMEKSNDFTPREILKHLAESPDDRIEIITTASKEPESIQETYRKTLNEIGYRNFDFLHICDTEPIHEDFHSKRVSQAKTVFFTGGDQNRICEIIKDSAINTLLHEKYMNEKGFTIAGTSAGAMCMPEIVICEAENGEAILDNDIRLTAGLNLINNCIIDTHFIHRGRFGRLAHAVILNCNCWGLGLGEDTALMIEEGNMATCKGSGMVLVINAQDVEQTNIDSVKEGDPIYADNLKVHILTDGCKIDLETGKVKGAEKKSESEA